MRLSVLKQIYIEVEKWAVHAAGLSAAFEEYAEETATSRVACTELPDFNLFAPVR